MSILPSIQPFVCCWLAAASDDIGPGDVPALIRGASLGAVGGAVGGVAEGVAEGHRAQRELLEVPLAPFFLNFQLHLTIEEAVKDSYHQPLEGAQGQFKEQLDLHGTLWGEGEDNVVDAKERDQQEGGLGQALIMVCFISSCFLSSKFSHQDS